MKNSSANKIIMILLGCLFLSWAAPNPGSAHRTPVIKLASVKEAIHRMFPQQKLFLKEVDLTDRQVEALESYGNWDSVDTHHKFFVSRGQDHSLKRAAVFMNEFTRHGNIVLAVAFDAKGRVVDVLITDIQSEILGWVEPLLNKNYTQTFRGKNSGMDLSLDSKWKTSSSMTQTYALIIANAVKKSAQLFDQVFK